MAARSALLLPFAARLFGGGGAKPRPPAGDGTLPPDQGDGWSTGWSEWPEPEDGRSHSRAEPAALDAPPPAEPEPPIVDRAVEHERFRALTATAAPAPVVHPRLFLGDRAALRRAVLLREVLGPPRALESLEGGVR